MSHSLVLDNHRVIEFKTFDEQRATDAELCKSPPNVSNLILNIPHCVRESTFWATGLQANCGAHCEVHLSAVEIGAVPLVNGIEEVEHGVARASLDNAISKRERKSTRLNSSH